MLKGLLESYEGGLGGVAGNGGEAGITDSPLGDAVTDILVLILLITNEAAERYRVCNNLEPVVGEVGSGLLGQRGIDHQDRLSRLWEISRAGPLISNKLKTLSIASNIPPAAASSAY